MTPAPTRTLQVLAATVAVLALAACSEATNTDVGAAPGEAGVTDVITVTNEAMAVGDGQRVCSLLTARAQRSFERATGSSGCLTAVKQQHARMTTEAKDALSQASVTGVAISGSTANATVTARLGARDWPAIMPGGVVALELVDARWLIDRPA